MGSPNENFIKTPTTISELGRGKRGGSFTAEGILDVSLYRERGGSSRAAKGGTVSEHQNPIPIPRNMFGYTET